MRELNIGHVLIRKRREKGLTQEELAAYLGVTKASVSKWETGQSYPDILLLPELATYFDISVDELLGYSPQLCSKDIRKYYKQFSEYMNKNRYEEIKPVIDNALRKYYSCYPFLAAMSQWLLNYGLMSDQDIRKDFFKNSIELADRVINNSDDTFLIRTAEGIKAYINLVTGEPQKVFDLLGEEVKPFTDASQIALMIQAYQLMGN